MSLSIACLGTSSQVLAQQVAGHDAHAALIDSLPPTLRQLASPSVTVAPEDLADTNIAEPVAVPAVATESFSSLAQAVAAHDGRDLEAAAAARCLAGAIYFEAKGEPLAGQLAVAEVIINRAKSGRFPADVCSVVTQRGQFSFVRGGQIPAIDAGRAAYRTALAIARVALAEAWDGPAPAALYFNTSGIRPAARLVKIAAVGNHIFYR